jgi:hypothetical protein
MLEYYKKCNVLIFSYFIKLICVKINNLRSNFMLNTNIWVLIQIAFDVYIILGLEFFSRADVQPKSSIPIGAKVEISPKGRAFTLGVKAELEKNLFNLPKVGSNCAPIVYHPWHTIGPHLGAPEITTLGSKGVDDPTLSNTLKEYQ